MPQLDLPLDQLHRYRAELSPPDDLWEFWRSTLSFDGGPEPRFTPVDSGLVVVTTYDVVFSGYGGHPVRAWLHLPGELFLGIGCSEEAQQQKRHNGEVMESTIHFAILSLAFGLSVDSASFEFRLNRSFEVRETERPAKQFPIDQKGGCAINP